MYKIIGADQKAYGPVSPEQIRQWIIESRVNGQTQVQVEGSEEWRPLSTFSEFADAFGGPHAPVPPTVAAFQNPADGREAALQAVKGPAVALKVTAIVGLIAVALGLVVNILSLAGIHFAPHEFGDQRMQMLISRFGGGLGIIQGIIGAVVAIVILNGASKMQNLKDHQFAFTAAIIAMVPCVSPCCWFGLPFGIWALVVLNRPEVKSQFT